MSSTPTSGGRPSFSLTSRKKSSEHRPRATSNEDLAHPKIKRDASSAFNYQTLADSTPVNRRRTTSSKAPVRSHSSSNAEIAYHLHQLRNLSKCKGALTTSDDQSKKDERIRLTSSNLKIICNESGPDSTVTMQSIETNIELPVSWKPAIQQITIQRDSWDHKIEFLLAVIGYAVDLGNLERSRSTNIGFLSSRKCLAVSNNGL